jgi:phage terminase small subunit
MPRRSAASLSVMSVDGTPPRLTPPPTLNEDAKRVFLDVVCSVRADHFQPADTLLLARYAECAVMAGDAATMLTTEGTVIDGKPSPWLSVHAGMVKAMLGLSHRLRLSPQGRSPTNPSRPVQAVSYYDRVRLEEHSAEPLPPLDRGWPGWENK